MRGAAQVAATSTLLRRISANLGAYERDPCVTTCEVLAEQVRAMAPYTPLAADMLSCVEQLASLVLRRTVLQLYRLLDECVRDPRLGMSVRFGLPPLQDPRKRRNAEWCPATEPATVDFTVCEFPTLENVGKPRGVCQVWSEFVRSHLPFDGDQIPWQSHASLVMLMKNVFDDMLFECGLASKLWLMSEEGTFELRPGLWTVRCGAIAVGVIRILSPKKGVLEDESVLGELYDYMQQLPNFYGTRHVIGILTTYHDWRVCWLDNDKTRELVAEVEVIPKETVPCPPKISLKKHTSDCHAIGEPEEEVASDETIAKAPRRLFGTRVWTAGNENVFQLVAPALLKMGRATIRPLDSSLENRLFPRIGRESLSWERLPPGLVLKWDTPPNGNANTFFFLEDLGHGSRCHSWLACSEGGAVCEVKFTRGDYRGGPLPGDRVALEQQRDWWRRLYPTLAGNVRMERLYRRNALILPHFAKPARDEATLALVEQCLRTEFVPRGVMHNQLWWHHIGVYKCGSETRVIVFGLEHVEEAKGDRDGNNWIDEAIERLRRRMVDAR
jgi:hypothetical protein